MLKILSAKQIKEVDAYTIKHEQIASINLMERACRAFVEWFVARFDATKKVCVVCGTGNNGGDGLGIARILHDWSFPVKVWIVRGEGNSTEDFKINLDRIKTIISCADITTAPSQNLFSDCDIIIDAIFGSGLSRKPEGIYEHVIKTINSSNRICVAVDLPSGLLADGFSEGEIVEADYTISFQFPKLAFLLPHNDKYVGDWHIVDIGLNKVFIKSVEVDHIFVTKKGIQKLITPREKFTHKGTYGHAFLVSGSMGKIGASILSAKAILRSGVGLVTIHAPQCGYAILQTAVPEAMVSVDSHVEIVGDKIQAENYTTLGIGPGLGKSKETVRAFRFVLETFRKPMVIDADALNILSENRELLTLIPPQSILTPHPKEFDRLVGASSSDFERLQKLKSFASSINCIVVLKGAHTSIASPDGKIYFNSTGNPGLATGGTGDVLTGIITGLLSQGYSSVNASILGVFLHGLAADIAVTDLSMEALTASDVIDYLPRAFKTIVNK